MYTFTCIVKKEGDQYASLCIELDIASCGATKEEAKQGLQNGVETYLEYMSSQGRKDDLFRPVPINAIKEFLFEENEMNEKSFQALPLTITHA